MIVRVADDLFMNSDHVLWAQTKPVQEMNEGTKMIVKTLDGQVWVLTWPEWEKLWK